MKIHSNNHSALFAMPSVAFAQIDPNLKAGNVDKTYRAAPIDKGARNPLVIKCGTILQTTKLHARVTRACCCLRSS